MDDQALGVSTDQASGEEPMAASRALDTAARKLKRSREDPNSARNLQFRRLREAVQRGRER